MPYSVTRDSSCPASKPYAVVKTSDGKVMGCHESKEHAQRQIAALYVNEAQMTDQEHGQWLFELADALPEVHNAPDDEWIEGKPIQILPAIGNWENPRFGTIEVTEQMYDDMIKNFQQDVRRQRIPVGIEHQPEHGAIARIKSVFKQGTDGLFAVPEWTARGVRLLKEKAFWYISPELYRKWKDPQSRTEYSNVLSGVAVTNNPFFKGMQEVMLSETLSELETDTNPESNQEGNSPMGNETQEKEPVQTNESTETPKDEATTPTPIPSAPAAPPTPAAPTPTAPPAPVASEVRANEGVISLTEFHALQERLTAAEMATSEERRARRRMEFRETYRAWSGNLDTNVDLMLTLSERLPEETFVKVHEMIEGLQRQVAGGALFSEKGTSRTQNGGTPIDQLTQVFNEMKTKYPEKTDPDLWSIVASEHPDLYEDYRARFRVSGT